MNLGTTRRRSLLRAGLLVGAIAGMCWILDRSAPTYAYTGTPTAPDVAPNLVLIDDTGSHFDLSQHRGEVVLVYFGYTHCPDVCPTTLSLIEAALARLGPDVRRVLTVFVTLDPGRDTPRLLRGFLAEFSADESLPPVGLTGTAEAIAAVARAWRVTWRPSGNGAFIDHTSVVTAVGPDGRLRLRYGFPQLSNPGAVARDIEHLLHNA